MGAHLEGLAEGAVVVLVGEGRLEPEFDDVILDVGRGFFDALGARRSAFHFWRGDGLEHLGVFGDEGLVDGGEVFLCELGGFAFLGASVFFELSLGALASDVVGGFRAEGEEGGGGERGTDECGVDQQAGTGHVRSFATGTELTLVW